MKIGVIGPHSSCRMIERSLRDIDDSLSVNCYEKEQVNACADVIEVCENECDAILFTGCAIESYAEEIYEIKKPHTSVEKSALSVSRAFLEMQKQQMELDAFSIDIVEHQVIEDLLDAFHILAKNIYSSSFCPGVEEKEYVDWHIQLQREGKVNVALTSLVWVYNTLREKGYPAIYLGPTRAMVRRALEKLQNECALQKAEYAQSAVEIFQLTGYERTEENYYSSLIEKADVEKEIIRYTKRIQGSIFSFGWQEYVVFSTVGAIKSKTNQHRLLQLQRQIREEGLCLNVGIGMGVTAHQAEMHARHALNYSLKYKKQEIYYIDAAETMHGPIGEEFQLEYQLISSDPGLQEISKATGLSNSSILKIIAIAEVRQSYVFDAHQLAECLNITVRSARRIMNRIIEAGYGKICAKESTAAGGRPKALVEMLFQKVK